MNIYEIRRYGTIAFLAIVVVVVVAFLYISNSLVADLSRQERARMQIWADATREIVKLSNTEDMATATDFDFLLSIIEENRNIPVLLTDDRGNIINHRNFDLPEPIDSLNPLYISEVNLVYLQRKLDDLQQTTNVIHIVIAPGANQHLYYEDSKLLRSLSLYPYVQLAVMLAFVAMVYFAVMSTKKDEQNKVWVGLSKETAHQLGTPISSLMAWTELLQSMDVDSEIVGEMEKDVKRLATVASRFGKIGSVPTLEPDNLNETVRQSVEYMRTRISGKITLEARLCPGTLPVRMSEPLLQWVLENLIKNAVDAMSGTGAITITTGREGSNATVTVADTGKGIPRKNFKTIFNPGYTTKKRGWGLGLALAKRIVEQYHGGTIGVASSEPGVGTTIALTLPLIH